MIGALAFALVTILLIFGSAIVVALLTIDNLKSINNGLNRIPNGKLDHAATVAADHDYVRRVPGQKGRR